MDTVYLAFDGVFPDAPISSIVLIAVPRMDDTIHVNDRWAVVSDAMQSGAFSSADKRELRRLARTNSQNCQLRQGVWRTWHEGQ